MSWTVAQLAANSEGGSGAAGFTYDASIPFAVGFGCGDWSEATFTDVVYNRYDTTE